MSQAAERAAYKAARQAFSQAFSGETQSFPHRKLSDKGKETLTCSIPKVVLEALRGKEFSGGQGRGNSAKQKFEMAVLEAAAPQAAKHLKELGLNATGAVSTITDAWFPKDEGEFKTHPIQRECEGEGKSARPTRYFWENAPTKSGGTRCAPRPIGSDRASSNQMERLTNDLAAIEALPEGPMKELRVAKAQLDLQLLKLELLAVTPAAE